MVLHFSLGVCSLLWKNVYVEPEYSFSGLRLTDLFSATSPHQSADQSSQFSETQLMVILRAMQ